MIFLFWINVYLIITNMQHIFTQQLDLKIKTIMWKFSPYLYEHLINV